jgi:hypothetical protein
MSYACDFGHLLPVIMLGCRTHGPTADDEVTMATSVPVVGVDAYFGLCVNVLIQRRLRSALASLLSRDIAASLLRVFAEASKNASPTVA